MAREADIELGLVNGSAGPATGHASARLGRIARRGTIASIQSAVSQWTANPLRFVRKLTNRHSQEPQLPPLCDVDRIARDNFFKVLITQQESSPLPLIEEAERLSAPCVKWYAGFLESRFRGAWTTVTREALKGLWELSNEPQPGEIGKVYDFMSVVIELLFKNSGLALVEIVDKADNKHLLKDQSDSERAIPNQLVFAAVGWLTMLYDPQPAQPPRELGIRRSVTSIPRQWTRGQPSRTFTKYRQQGFEGFDQELFIFLRRFGRLIPDPDPGLADGEQLITVSYVCFAMLDKVADIEVEWVNSLSLHLEFDNVRRVLKVFRFPSFCMLMCRDRTSVSNLYLDHSRYYREQGLEEQTEDMTPNFFREVLLSYRLIFGQDAKSSKMFRKKLSTLEENWDCSDKQSHDADPMLRTLCCMSHKSQEARQIYRAIDVSEDVSPYYYPDSDFPFLGRRILNLQAFVNGRNPHNWRALWHDRRNVAFWWTFWAVLFIGGGTMFIGLVQAGFQIWGSISAQKQLGSPNSSPAST